jgi:protein associated with RNAse G/E
MSRIVKVRLVKRRGPPIEYEAAVVSDDGTHIVVRAPWSEQDERNLGFVRFEPGDVFTEHYWRDRWYSIKEVRSAGRELRGWYCDVARPAVLRDGVLVSDDLDLDLWASADGRTILRLDEDEFLAGDLETSDPDAFAEARRALDELERLAREGFGSKLRA